MQRVKTMRSLIVGLLSFALLPVGTAAAVAPSLLSVAAVNRHPQLTFSAPFADSGTVYLATRPDRASDGGFLSENLETLDLLTGGELAAGFWFSESQIDPGAYWAMIRASADFGICFDFNTGTYQPSCADGYSEPVPFTVPKPRVRWLTSARPYRALELVDLRLVGRPLGERVGYRVCWINARGARKCRPGVVFGFDWNSQASHSLFIATRGMSRVTVFRWYVRNRQVAARRVVVG